MTLLLFVALLMPGQEAAPTPTRGLCRLTGIKVEMLADSETLARGRYRTAEDQRVGEARHAMLEKLAAALKTRFGTAQPSRVELQRSDSLDNDAMLSLAAACRDLPQ
ncbi:hypothetical protein [Sphingomonas kyeonggiensis]|uniref:hypothetical protein n=1 Tax=Sphingomonas kyeonggiensis TaxID=1268553 RepID=UPI0027D7F294|nr:hypothetical protein [Sphingomonas kyeonggiensis]